MRVIKKNIKKFVDNNSYIIDKYESIKKEKEITNIIGKIGLIVFLKIKYIKHKSKYSYDIPLKLVYPEAKEKIYDSKFIELNMKSNNIYFVDIFNILLLLRFPKENDLYDLVGCELGIYNYSKYRENAIRELKNNKIDGNILENLYMLLSKWCGIDIAKIKESERKLLFKYSIANPVLINEIDILLKNNHQVYACNNSLFKKEDLKALLLYHGYNSSIEILNDDEIINFDKLVISKKPTLNRKPYHYIYYGTKFINDLRKLKDNKWSLTQCPDIHSIAEKYRITTRGFLDMELYNGIINTTLYTTYQDKSFYQKHGFIYGGFLICNFCKWLNQLASFQGVEKFLFLSRDCLIVNKVYNKYYNKFDHEYVKFSRFASQQLMFEDYTEEYINDVLATRVKTESKKTVYQVLHEVDLELLIEFVSEKGISENHLYDEKTYTIIKELIYEKKIDIINYFEETKKAAIHYFKNIIGNNKKICVVDLGWRGTSIGYLKHFLKKEISNKIEVIGALIGAADCKFAQNLISTNQLFCYAFDNEYFRGFHDNNQNRMSYLEILCYEALFSSSEDTLLKYKLGEEVVQFIYGSTNNSRIVNEMHIGVLDFAGIYNEYKSITSRVIPGKDAFMPLYQVIQNEDYRNKFLKEYYETENALQGFSVGQKITI